MKHNDTIAAPSVPDAASAYELWHLTHMGSTDDFYRFMTTPSAERTAWLESVDTEMRLIGSVAAEIVKP